MGSDPADLGPAVEVGGHVVVPDYATGRVWIVNLHTMRVVVDQQLFDRPVRFELLTRDGVVFYNDPDSDQAGILELDGTVRAVSKYNPVKPDSGPNQVAVDSPSTRRQSPSSGRPGSGPPAAVPPVSGPGVGESVPPTPVGAPMADIVIKPRNRGVVGEEFELAVIARSPIGLATAEWTFGDGTSSTGLVVRHRWDHPGEYQVAVAMKLTIGLPAAVATATIVIEPAEAPPRIVGINVAPSSPQVGETVRFSAAITGRWPERWEWTIQGKSVSSVPEFLHTFAVPGIYTVALVVTAGVARVQQSTQVTVEPEPPAVRCGDVLTESAVLKTDLVCPQDTALTIAADNVTLDLRGHTLTSDNPPNRTIGIKVAGPRTIRNVIIKNGKITRFNSGIYMTNVSGVDISDMMLTSLPLREAPWLFGDITGSHARNVHVVRTTLSGLYAFIFENNSELTITNSILANDAVAFGRRPSAICTQYSTCKIGASVVRAFSIGCGVHLEEITSALAIEDSSVDMYYLEGKCTSMTFRNNRTKSISVYNEKGAIFTGNTVTPRPEGDIHSWEGMRIGGYDSPGAGPFSSQTTYSLTWTSVWRSMAWRSSRQTRSPETVCGVSEAVTVIPWRSHGTRSSPTVTTVTYLRLAFDIRTATRTAYSSRVTTE